MFNLFESTAIYQLQKIDSDFGEYVSLLMRKQTLQEQRQSLELQKNDIYI